MYESVGAIRYIDPTWDEVASGDRLWPSIAYGLGLVNNKKSKEPYSAAESSQSDEKDANSETTEEI